MPDFSVEGKLHTSVCSITKPFTGEITLKMSEAPIKSIELQLVRVETCGCLEGYAKDATEIQNIQIAEGDVCRNMSIPLYVPFVPWVHFSQAHDQPPQVHDFPPTLYVSNFGYGQLQG